tara:strand:+ start:1059 stop:4118 length:3060 start_codon:yes stop_codon:yes gene_type:complete
MSERKFRFVSPGVFVNEIDNSQLPNQLPDVGPVIIGRSERGPGLVPKRVQSPSEFIELYGNPIPGRRGGDVWRDGNYVGPTYGAYAAMAYLRAGVGPVTYMRLVGEQASDATTGGEAGWSTMDSSLSIATTPNEAIASNAGAYGLFIANSSSANKGGAAIDRNGGNAFLAAVFYMNSGCSIALSGAIATASYSDTYAGTHSHTAAAALPIGNVDAGVTFKAIIDDGSETYTTKFDFDKNSSKYVRKVFNTNPQLGNSNHTETSALNNLEDKYWLGETYDRFISDKITKSAKNELWGAVISLQRGGSTTSSDNFAYQKKGFRDPETGWVFSQDTATDSTGFDAQISTQKLFKFIGLNHGQWASRNLKVSIKDIKTSTNEIDPYGTFTILVRMASDSDNAPEIVEQFTNCNLNPASENYVAKKVGDRYYSWLEGEKRLRLYGEYDNMSNYIRIEVNESVAAGATDAGLLPFGFYGPVKLKDYTIYHGLGGNYVGARAFKSGSFTEYTSWFGIGRTQNNASLSIPKVHTDAGSGTTYTDSAGQSWIIAMSGADGTGTFNGDSTGGYCTASILFPQLPLRLSASDGGLSNIKNAYFGIDTGITRGSTRHNPGYGDYLKPVPGTSHIFAPSADSGADIGGALEYSFVFTLDDVSGSTGVYVSGSRAGGYSLSARKNSFTGTLDAGFNRFTMPLFGGHDGLDITEQEPFSNKAISGTDERANYELYTVKRAINTISDPEFVEANILSVPGVTNTVITDQLISVAENRADALAVIDIENVYTPKTETTESYVNRLGTVKTAVDALRARRLNSSYACTYYPWVQIRDNISSTALWVPPSVVAIGTFASSEAKAELWFAPAGFSRGGLSDGSAGWPVLSTTERLRREDRDDLYSANINPIASFPSEGIVIFGQKTLQITPSALDRINVRRLLVFLKKRISRIASGILFDQNVRTTWTRFKGEADKFLGSVQARLGLTEFRVVLDETTTTPDLVDRNILYAKIYLKPARSIEFIAIDFVITKTGASFDD